MYLLGFVILTVYFVIRHFHSFSNDETGGVKDETGHPNDETDTLSIKTNAAVQIFLHGGVLVFIFSF